MRALILLILALLMLAAAAYPAVAERRRKLNQLDHRLTRKVSGTLAVARRERSIAVPDMVAPLLARAQIEPSVRAVSLGIGGVLLLSLLALLVDGPVVSCSSFWGCPACSWSM